MVAAAQPEIRFRLDRQERDQFEQVGIRIGMSPNDMVKVFVKRAIAEGGLPFEMRDVAIGQRHGERFMPIFGQAPALLAEVASNAAREAALGHIHAGRLTEDREKETLVEFGAHGR